MSKDYTKLGIDVGNLSFMDGGIHRTADDEGTAVQDRPIMMGDVLYMPALKLRFGVRTLCAAGTGPQFAMLGLSISNVGLSVRLSPVQLREMAGMMLKSADDIDAHAATQAAAALAKAAQGGAE